MRSAAAELFKAMWFHGQVSFCAVATEMFPIATATPLILCCRDKECAYCDRVVSLLPPPRQIFYQVRPGRVSSSFDATNIFRTETRLRVIFPRLQLSSVSCAFRRTWVLSKTFLRSRAVSLIPQASASSLIVVLALLLYRRLPRLSVYSLIFSSKLSNVTLCVLQRCRPNKKRERIV